MITTTELQEKVTRYRECCRVNHIAPTYKGISGLLGISHMTVSNVVHGQYNHKPYGSRPHKTRCIDNDDFEILQELFKGKDDHYE